MNRTRRYGHKGERGAALLTVLVQVAVISAITVAIVDDIRFSIHRTANFRDSEASYWYAIGAEYLAKEVLARSWRLSPGRSNLGQPWAGAGTTTEVPGGVVVARIRDGSNCFNLNSVVTRDETRFVEDETGVAEFRNLLSALDFDEGQRISLSNALVDWIDSDNRPTNQGAEDSYYSNLMSPYRTGDTLLADASELRAIRGFDATIFGALRPYVCALPTSDLSPINPNTLIEMQVPLIIMLAGGDMTPAEAARVITGRPADGYASLHDFWAHDAFAGRTIPQNVRSQVKLSTRYFRVLATVKLDRAYLEFESLLEQKPDGQLDLVWRRFGAES